MWIGFLVSCCDLYLFRKVTGAAVPCGASSCWRLSSCCSVKPSSHCTHSSKTHQRARRGNSTAVISCSVVSHLDYFWFAPGCPEAVLTRSAKTKRLRLTSQPRNGSPYEAEIFSLYLSTPNLQEGCPGFQQRKGTTDTFLHRSFEHIPTAARATGLIL